MLTRLLFVSLNKGDTIIQSIITNNIFTEDLLQLEILTEKAALPVFISFLTPELIFLKRLSLITHSHTHTQTLSLFLSHIVL
jgi:hypothetical protein